MPHGDKLNAIVTTEIEHGAELNAIVTTEIEHGAELNAIVTTEIELTCQCVEMRRAKNRVASA
jgi:molybdopterin-binding protein